MHIPPFKIERYFARYEFSAPYLLSCSDCEPLTLPELLAHADDDLRSRWETLWLGYNDSQGEPLLREEITKLYTTIKPEQLVVLTPIEGIFIAMNTVLQKGDHCIVTFPGYQSLYEVARSLGAEVSYWKPDESKGWYFDVDTLEAALTPKTKLIVINFPHNPTGAMITTEQLTRIVELARKHNIIIFSDEMYRYLEFDPTRRLPSIADMYEHGVALSGMSKTFALPGLRIGWLASQNKQFIEAVMTFKDYTTICTSGPSQMLSAIGLRAKGALLTRNLALVSNNITATQEFINKNSDRFSWSPSQAGSVAFIRYAGKEGVSALSQRLIEKEGLMILPSTVFDYGDNHWRIGLGRKNVPELLERLNAYFTAQ